MSRLVVIADSEVRVQTVDKCERAGGGAIRFGMCCTQGREMLRQGGRMRWSDGVAVVGGLCTGLVVARGLAVADQAALQPSCGVRAEAERWRSVR